jgi:hypothetical protein
MFIPIIFDVADSYQSIHNNFSSGITTKEEYELQLIRYGGCNIVVPIKSIPRLLIEEILNPFYLF